MYCISSGKVNEWPSHWLWVPVCSSDGQDSFCLGQQVDPSPCKKNSAQDHSPGLKQIAKLQDLLEYTGLDKNYSVDL